jgi:DUF1680 family protein
VGDVIRLELPMAPRWTFPDRRVDALRDTVAVERGPLVYCAESVADEIPLADVAVRVSSSPVDHPPIDQAGTPEPPSGAPADPVDPVVEVEIAAVLGSPEANGWPYGPDPDPATGAETVVRLVPYHRWGNRGPATMRVWLPVAE